MQPTDLTPTDWQRVFALSRVNGADNCQDLLPSNGWKFPENSWLKKRLQIVRGSTSEGGNHESPPTDHP